MENVGFLRLACTCELPGFLKGVLLDDQDCLYFRKMTINQELKETIVQISGLLATVAEACIVVGLVSLLDWGILG